MIAPNPKLDPLITDPVQAILEQPVSASRLNTFHSCRLKFYFKYIEQLQKPSSYALQLGKSVHASLQEWSKRRWLGKPCGVDDIRAGFDEHWATSLEENPVEFDSGEEVLEKSKTLALVEMYLRETPIPVDEKPEAVEVGVEADLSSHGLPNLRGFIDLIRPGGCIVDFKTTATTPNEEQVFHRNELQLTAYGVLYREATDQQESGFELHHLVKTKVPKLVVTRHTPVNERQRTKLFQSMESFVSGVQREDWVPSPGLQCASCEYFNECRGGAACV